MGTQPGNVWRNEPLGEVAATCPPLATRTKATIRQVRCNAPK
jgi:hypothetical protein